ncbi:Alpha/Beta hydrolase protein [Dactylonectria estremocensis]|uniref:Alpha/Beta hydrolase protein n=1 Tax=Dactylonectria estremocensis TaxID=1079267 RepID=A0A9P9DZ06_9HYPO|nr:Alpha/Beta hydrolase protein [Dactylonectria estremocensis]
MWRLIELLVSHPLNTIAFCYTFTVQFSVILARCLLLPHVHRYQSFRTLVQRAYWSSAYGTFRQLIHRLPVVRCPETRARRVGSDWTGYIIPGTKRLDNLPSAPADLVSCVAVYAHGGGYGFGEARMYLNYMDRFVSDAEKVGLDITFLSVEYPLTDVASHPAQQDAFLSAYRYLLRQGVPPTQIVFMGDSAGGGCCILSSLELQRQGLPQPSANVLISPWFDMSLKSFEGGSAFTETDYITQANFGVPVYARKWIGSIPGDSPTVNPLFVDEDLLRTLPPTLVLAGGGDFVLPECRDLARRFTAAGVRHELIVEWGQLHLYALGSKWIDPRVREKTDTKIFEWVTKAIQGAE